MKNNDEDTVKFPPDGMEEYTKDSPADGVWRWQRLPEVPGTPAPRVRELQVESFELLSPAAGEKLIKRFGRNNAIVAVHESGHAVAAFELGIHVELVTIDDDPGGHCLARKSGLSQRQRERDCVMLLAGIAAENRVFMRPSDGDRGDVEVVEQLLRHGNRTGDLSEDIERLRRRAVKLVKRPTVWFSIERFTFELLRRGTLTAADIHKLRWR